MFANLPQQLRAFKKTHRNQLTLILVEALPRYSSSLLYALLSVMIAAFSNAAIAGVAFSAFALFELFISDPLGGTLADKIGARFTMRVQAVVAIIAGIMLLLLPRTVGSLVVIGFVLFTAFGLRMIGAYLLRMIKRDEGGLIFGLSESTISLAYFLSTLSIPFLARSDRASWIAVLLIISSSLYLIYVSSLPDDRTRIITNYKGSAFNPLNTVRHGLHFVHRNQLYPLMPLATSLFEGIFYSTIWFLFPLRFVAVAASGGAGLELGIYDLVTLLFAGLCGYLADRYNWKFIHSLGWFLIGVGVIILPAVSVSTGLILAGLVIAVGNNLSYFSAEHVLAKYDIDHREDGSFMALMTMLRSFGYVVSPTIVGYLYYRFNFSSALLYACGLSFVIALFMIRQTWKMEKRELAEA